MKTKGIAFWEQHLEHMVVALAALVLIGFVALQFVGNPNSVPLPQGKQREMVGPATVDPLLADKANDLLRKMSPDTDSGVLPNPVPLETKFNDLKVASVSPAPAMAVAFEPNIHPLGGAIPNPRTPFAVAQIP